MADWEHQSSSSSIQRPLLCKCGDEPILLTSQSKKNPGKFFWRCPHWNEVNGCKFFEWAAPVSNTNNNNVYEDEVRRYVMEIEDLKEKLAAVMNQRQAYIQEIEDLKKRSVKDEENCLGYHEQIVQLKMKVGKQQMKIVVERNKVKLLCFVTIVLWVFVTLLSIVIVMNVGGSSRGFGA